MVPHSGQNIGRLRNRGDLAALLPNRFDQRHKRVQLPGTKHEIKMRKLVQQFISKTLRHAAERSDNEIGILRLEFFHIADLALRLAFRLLANTAGIEQQDVGFLLDIDHRMTGFDQHSGQRFGVALVHLATVGLDMDLHGKFNVRLSR